MLVRSAILGVVAAVGLRLLLVAAPASKAQEPTTAPDYETLYSPMVLSDLCTALEDRKSWLSSLTKELLDELESNPEAGDIVRLEEGKDLLAGSDSAALRICYGSTLDPAEARLLRIPVGENETLDLLLEEIHWLDTRVKAFESLQSCPQ